MALSGQEQLHNLALGMIGEEDVEDTTESRALKQNQLCVRFYPSARDLTLRSHPWNEAKKRVILAQTTDSPVFGYDRRYTEPTDSLRILSVNNSLGADVRNNAAGIQPWEVEQGEIYSDSGEVPETWSTNKKFVDGDFFSSTGVNWVTGTAFIKDQFVRDGGLVFLVLVNHTADTIANDVTAGNLQAGVQGSTGTYEVLVSHISDTLLNDVASGDIQATGSEARVIFVEYVFQLTDTTLFSANLEEAISVQLAIKIYPGIKGTMAGKEDLINEFERLTMPKARSIDAQQMKPKPIFNSQWIRSRSSGTIRRR